MTYRTQVRIIADVLATARDFGLREGVGITVLLRKGNLSYARLTKILRDLTSSGLLIEVAQERGNKYVISEKGLKFLDACEVFEEFAQSFGLRV